MYRTTTWLHVVPAAPVCPQVTNVHHIVHMKRTEAAPCDFSPFHETKPRRLRLTAKSHLLAAAAMTLATSRGWEMYTAWLAPGTSVIFRFARLYMDRSASAPAAMSSPATIP